MKEESALNECICEGNWRALIKETEGKIGKTFVNDRGERFCLFGIVHGSDDYYYGMHGTDGMRLLSCVGSIEGYGYHESL